MNVLDLIILLRKKGVNIKIEEDNVVLFGSTDKISTSLLLDLRERKEEIKSYLNEKKVKYTSLDKFEKVAKYPLSHSQISLYFIYKMEPNSIAYNMPQVLYFTSEFDQKKLIGIFTKLIERHSILRVRFKEENGIPIQYIKDEFSIDFTDITDYDKSVDEIVKSFVRPFDLENDLLIRFGLIYRENHWILIIDMHHIITDGVSNLVLNKEFEDLYMENSLSPLSIDYLDYCLWQNTDEYKVKIEKSKKFWMNCYIQDVPRLNLPLDYKRIETRNKKGKSIKFNLTVDKIKLIHDFSRVNELTLQMTMLGLLGILFSKLSGQEDLIIGKVTTGRNHGEVENVIGNFTNVLPMRLKVLSTVSVYDYFREIRKQSIMALENQDYPFNNLVRDLSLHREEGREPCFDILFNFMNHDRALLDDESDLLQSNLITSKGFDLVVNVNAYQDDLQIVFQYCNMLFNDDTILKFISNFQNLILEISLGINKNISEIEIITINEKKDIINNLTGRSKEKHEKSSTIQTLFEKQVELSPNMVAVKFGTKSITYLELNIRANYVANLLLYKTKGKRVVIGIILDNSLDLIISILAVLKSGNIYSLVNPESPDKVREEILSKAKIELIIIDSKAVVSLEKNKLMKIIIDDEETKKGVLEENVRMSTNSDVIAIINNIGTRGEYNGVEINNELILNLLLDDFKFFKFSSNDKWYVSKSMSLLFNSLELFGSLLFGGQLILGTQEELENEKTFYQSVFNHGITILNLTPIEYLQLRNRDRIQNTSLAVRCLFLTGGIFDVKDIWDWKRKYYEAKVVSIYYLPEIGTIPLFKEITYNDISNGKCVVGKPSTNTTVYILDNNNKLVPQGSKGEICIVNKSINCYKYMNPFIQNPFNSDEILYKTGDYGRQLSNNEIEFLGSKKVQIVRNGKRIEVEEIERLLQECDDIIENKIIAKNLKDGKQKLIAFYVGKIDSIEILKEFLAERLPVSIIPEEFIEVQMLPRKSCGEIDIETLLTLELTPDLEYLSPTTLIEKEMLKIWEIILPQRSNIGMLDNFFEIGGHSLKILNMVALIKERLDVYIPIMFIYANPYIKIIADAIEHNSYANNEISYFNEKDKNKIFCLPPGISYGICYKMIAENINQYCFCAFNFVDSENFIQRTVDKIIEIQPESPYILLGYSGGGKALYPVAKELERRGKKIASIVLIDGYWQNNKNVYDVLEIYKEFLHELDHSHFDYLSTELKKRIKKYDRFLRDIEFDEEPLDAKIHFLLSQGGNCIESDDHIEKEIVKVRNMKSKYTKGKIEIYKTLGLHGDLLNLMHVDTTSKLIREILIKDN
jgi:non-ribosomal peptide synthetase component F